MEEVGDKFVFRLNISSSNGWTDRGHEQDLGIFVKKLSD
jgi:hypothetical protein